MSTVFAFLRSIRMTANQICLLVTFIALFLWLMVSPALLLDGHTDRESIYNAASMSLMLLTAAVVFTVREVAQARIASRTGKPRQPVTARGTLRFLYTVVAGAVVSAGVTAAAHALGFGFNSTATVFVVVAGVVWFTPDALREIRTAKAERKHGAAA